MNSKCGVKIRELMTPPEDLSNFDPGQYLSGLEFESTNEPIVEKDRDGLAQLVHFIAFLALQEGSPAFGTAIIPKDTTAYTALESHFGHLDGWSETYRSSGGVTYRALVNFLMVHYPPHRPA